MWSVLLILGLSLPIKQDAAKTDSPRPSVARLWPKLKDLQVEQKEQLKKITEDYAAQIAELEAERDQRLAALLSKPQREELAAMVAEEVDRYRVVLKAKFNRPGPAAPKVREILGLESGEALKRLNAAPEKPVAENLPRAKADALVKALNAAGAKAVMEKQEAKQP
jgi:ribosomal protein L7/L12